MLLLLCSGQVGDWSPEPPRPGSLGSKILSHLGLGHSEGYVTYPGLEALTLGVASTVSEAGTEGHRSQWDLGRAVSAIREGCAFYSPSPGAAQVPSQGHSSPPPTPSPRVLSELAESLLQLALGTLPSLQGAALALHGVQGRGCHAIGEPGGKSWPKSMPDGEESHDQYL